MFRIPYQVRFPVFLSFDILSLLCTLFLFRFLLFDRKLRRFHHNYIIIILLFLGFFYELTNIPFHLRNDFYGTPWLASNNFYIFWVFLDYSLYSIQISLFAWASIERHILIFKDSWLSTRVKRLFIHYLPPLAIMIYYLIYYCMIYFNTPCNYPFNDYLNGGLYVPCAFDRTFWSAWELLAHQTIPTLIIMIFSLSLLIRVVKQKHHMQRSINWRQHRKMTIQLLSISIIYVVFNTPWVAIMLGYQYGLQMDIAYIGLIYAKFFLYNIIFLFPFVCCLSLPELKLKLKYVICICSKRQHQINPSTLIRQHTLQNLTQN